MRFYAHALIISQNSIAASSANPREEAWKAANEFALIFKPGNSYEDFR